MTSLINGEYENYNITSKSYNITRYASGIDLILNEIVAKKSNTIVLEAGFGTGNFLSTLAPYVTKMHGIDISDGMIEQCTSRVQKYSNVTLTKGDVRNTNYNDNMFDIIYSCQMIHHLGNSSEINKFIKEMYRILKPSGKLIINWTTDDQMRSFWHLNLIPDTLVEIKDRFLTHEQMCKLYLNNNLIFEKYILLKEPLMKPDIYYETDNIFQKWFRDGDSTWALVSNEKLDIVLNKCKDKKYIKNILEYSENKRKTIGISTTIIGIKT
jgi:ubiquinone/menaquinone biosynthesis C-methylase UbiE